MWFVLALISACCFGMRGILYHWSSQQGMDRNLMLLGVFSMGAVASLFFWLITWQEWTLSALVGILMGLFSFLANASMFKGFAVGKSSIIAILTALPSVVVVLLAYLLWGEKLSGMQFVSFALIIIGILLVRYSNDLKRGNLQGAQWGVLAMLFFAFNDMSGKLSTRLEANLFPTLTCMFVTGSVAFFIWWRSDVLKARARSRGEVQTKAATTAAVLSAQLVERDDTRRVWMPRATYLAGMAIGLTNFTGMVLIINAFRDGITGLVSAVVAMNAVIILLYSGLILKERLRPIEIVGMTASILGIVSLKLF